MTAADYPEAYLALLATGILRELQDCIGETVVEVEARLDAERA